MGSLLFLSIIMNLKVYELYSCSELITAVVHVQSHYRDFLFESAYTHYILLKINIDLSSRGKEILEIQHFKPLNCISLSRLNSLPVFGINGVYVNKM